MGNVRLLGVRNSGANEGGLRRILSRLQGNQRRVKVALNEKPYWMEQGWIQKGNVFRGKYITRFGARRGEIVEQAGKFDVFIFKPPRELRRHPEWDCFMRRGASKFFIHLTKHPKGVSSAIVNVQRMINESFSF